LLKKDWIFAITTQSALLVSFFLGAGAHRMFFETLKTIDRGATDQGQAKT